MKLDNILIAFRHPFNSKKRKELRRASKQQKFLKNSKHALASWHKAISTWRNKDNTWLEFGTLLGAYREKNIISHDYDLDFAIDEAECTEEFINWLTKFGFKLHHTMKLKSNIPSLNGFIAEYVFRYRSSVNIDLFVCKKLNDSRLFFAFDSEDGLTREETKEKYNGALRVVMRTLSDFSLIDIELLGFNFKAPSPIERHLEELYGTDFMTPKAYKFSERPRQFEKSLNPETLGFRINP